MKSETKKQSCKYCKIFLVDVQQTSSTADSFAFKKQHSQAKVMKCPVCGYSELRELEFQNNHSATANISAVKTQTTIS